MDPNNFDYADNADLQNSHDISKLDTGPFVGTQERKRNALAQKTDQTLSVGDGTGPGKPLAKQHSAPWCRDQPNG